jgi:hypothetical protein
MNNYIATKRYRKTVKGHAKYLEMRKEYVKRNHTRVRAYDAAYKLQHKEKMIAYRRKRTLAKYGITESDYKIMFENQEGKCAICRKDATNFTRKLGVDHNHKTGQVRGLLCYHCNKFIVGRHTLESATKLVNYLEIERRKNVQS